MPNTLLDDLGGLSFDAPSMVLGPVDGLGWENPVGAVEPMPWGPVGGDAFRLLGLDDASGEAEQNSEGSTHMLDWADLLESYGGGIAEAIASNLGSTSGEGIINNFLQVLFPAVNANALLGQFQSGNAGELVEDLLQQAGEVLPQLVDDADFGFSNVLPELVDDANLGLDIPGFEAVVDQLTGLQGGELLLPTSTDDLTSLVDNVLQLGESVLSILAASDLPGSDPFLSNGEPVAPELMNQELAPAATQDQKLSSESFWSQADGGVVHLGSTNSGLIAAPTIEKRTTGGLTRPRNSTELFWWQPPGGIGTWEARTSA